MKTQKIKFEPLQAGITKHIKTGKPIVYLEFYLGDVVYNIYEFLPMDNTFYTRLNSLELIIKYFGGVNNLKRLVNNLTVVRVLKIVHKPTEHCDA